MTSPEQEIDRLRALVGPSEVSYRQLTGDVEAASAAARDAELAAGRLRGELREMSVQLARARQDQDTMQRRREMGAVAYVRDLGRELWVEVLRPRLASAVRPLRRRR